jgi:hypothetical protein
MPDKSYFYHTHAQRFRLVQAERTVEAEKEGRCVEDVEAVKEGSVLVLSSHEKFKY